MKCSLMKFCCGLLSLSLVVLGTGDCIAEVKITAELSQDGSFFRFDNVPLPAIDDAGSKGKWRVVAGQGDANSGSIECLFDGRVPTSADQPSENFFFAAGTQNGLIAVDLEQVTDVAEIVSYSWHTDSRAPQVFSVYAATGEERGFAFPVSVDGISIASGWKKIASVNTHQANQNGGQHAVKIFEPDATLGKFRHLLFEINATEPGNRFSHTFFSEIDVVAADATNVQRIKSPEVREIKFSTTDEAYRFTIDVTQALELEMWTADELKPLIQEWYPKIVAMLPSEGFEAARHVRFRFLRDEEMKGIPAYASGPTISMNAEWFRGQLNGEARGAVVHEMVHVVQGYSGRNRRGRGLVAPPGWIVEGIPDYIRWFLFEPETGGAKLSAERLKEAKHDASYRTSANFIDWVIRNHPNDGRFLEQLNAAARGGRYSGETWKELTGKTEQELADVWREDPLDDR
jgi:hypothetical protein